MNNRTAELIRETTETRVRCRLDLDGEGRSQVQTGLGFLDHMLDALGRHGRLDLELSCQGDLAVDDHHSVEDCALALGRALDKCLGTREGIARFGWALVPMDEALAQVSLDLGGRAHATVDLGLSGQRLGQVACENLVHFFRSLAGAGRLNLHLRVLAGENDHHRAEAAFKALALALRQAVARSGKGIPSTKGVLE